MTAGVDFSYCPQLQQLLKSDSVHGRTEKEFRNLSAISTPNNLIVLRNIMLDIKPERTLEIGMSFGGSTLVMTCSHKDLGRETKQQHIALDPFQTQVWDDVGRDAVEKSGLSGYLDFRAAFSALELPRLWERGTRFQLIYVDGSHIFEDVFVDMYYSIRLLEKNGFILFDDCANPHVAKAISFMKNNFSGLRELNLSWYRADQGRSWRYRVGGFLGRRQLRAFRRDGDVQRPWNAKFIPF
jgi:predicted O-methyltransferase YrrM